MRVLVVDDDEGNRTVMSELIEVLGHCVTGARDRPSALAQMCSEPPQVAFIDLRLGADSGLDVARERRQQEAESNLPRITIYGLTGDATDEAVDACLAAGMDDCLFKPTYLEVLEARLGKPGGA